MYKSIATMVLLATLAASAFGYDYSQLTTTNGTQARLDQMFQNYQPFSGMKLLDHDPLFSKYIRTSRTTGRQGSRFLQHSYGVCSGTGRWV
jgi:hypothetical protein